jgi:hypothetical protein
MKEIPLLDQPSIAKIIAAKQFPISNRMAANFEVLANLSRESNSEDTKYRLEWGDPKTSTAEYLPYLIWGVKRTKAGKRAAKDLAKSRGYKNNSGIKKFSFTLPNKGITTPKG